MSFRLSSCFRMCLAVTALAWGGLLAGTVLAEDKPAAAEAEASGQKSPATNITVIRSAGPRNGLLRLEEQLSRSFQFLKPSSSLEGVPAPPMPSRAAPPLLNKRAKEALDKRKNWMSATPDDPTAGPKLEDMLNMPDYGSDRGKKKAPSSVERFYQDLEKKSAAKAKRDPFAVDDLGQRNKQPGMAQEFDSAEDPNLPSGIRSSEKELRKLLRNQGSAFAPASVRGSMFDVFGMGEKTEVSPEELAHKAYLKDFQQWLNRPASGPATGLASPVNVTDPSRQGVVATSGLNPFAPVSRPDNFDPSLGAANPTLLVGTPQDVSAKVLNQWNPFYFAPKIEPTKTPPPKSTFDVPRRKF